MHLCWYTQSTQTAQSSTWAIFRGNRGALGMVICVKEFQLLLHSRDYSVFCVQQFYLSYFSVFCTIGTICTIFFDCYRQRDCPRCTPWVSHGPNRNVCIIPGDPFYCCSYYCAFSVYDTGKHSEHKFWRPSLLDASPFSVAWVLPTSLTPVMSALSEQGGGRAPNSSSL